MAKKKTAKAGLRKRNVQDATLKNTRPLIRRVAGLEGSVAVLISRADEAEVRIRDLTKRVQDLEAGAGAPILPVI